MSLATLIKWFTKNPLNRTPAFHLNTTASQTWHPASSILESVPWAKTPLRRKRGILPPASPAARAIRAPQRFATAGVLAQGTDYRFVFYRAVAFATQYCSVAVLIGALFFSACKPATTPASSTASSVPPRLLRVVNTGTNKVGFYTAAGAYGFGSATNSLLSVTTLIDDQQVAQHSTNGIFYVGSGANNKLTYINGFNGKFKMANQQAASQFSAGSGAIVTGVALSESLSRVFIADSLNQKLVILNALTGGFITGSSASSTYSISGTSIRYVAYDESTRRVVATNPSDGTVMIFNATSGAEIIATPSPLTLYGGGCASPSTIGKVEANATASVAYVLCGTRIILITLSGTPGYFSGTLAGATKSSGLTTATALLYVPSTTLLYAVGGTQVSILDATATVLNTIDLEATYTCDAGLTLGGVAYDAATNSLYVSDMTNSRIYRLNGSTLALYGGSCANSTFTGNGISTPTNLSFY